MTDFEKARDEARKSMNRDHDLYNQGADWAHEYHIKRGTGPVYKQIEEKCKALEAKNKTLQETLKVLCDGQVLPDTITKQIKSICEAQHDYTERTRGQAAKK